MAGKVILIDRERIPSNLICEIENCNNKAKAIIRTKYVCKECFSTLLKDNVRKYKKDIQIDDQLDIYKSCIRYKCAKKIPTILKYTKEGELLPIYCSKECEEIDKKTDKRYKYQGFRHILNKQLAKNKEP